MDGPAVFRFAVEVMPRCIREVLEKSGESMDAVDWFVCHQANERIIDLSIKKLTQNAPSVKAMFDEQREKKEK